MIISSLDTIIVDLPFKNPGPPSGFGGKEWTTITSLLVRIETDKGIVGWGEAFGFNCVTSTEKTIQDLIKPLLIGCKIETPQDIEEISNMLQLKLHIFGRYGITIFAISGIDIALWDICGKSNNKPIAELLGGIKSQSLTAYASLFKYDIADDTKNVSLRALEDGYNIIKLHENLIEPIEATRNAIGNNIKLMVDVNCAWKEEDISKILQQLLDCKLYWLEEPIWPPENFQGLANLRKQGLVISTGENACTHWQFKEIITQKAADIIQPSVTKVGGVTEMKKISQLDLTKVRMVPHAPYFGPGFVATLHVLTALSPNSEIERLYMNLEQDLYKGLSNIDSKGNIFVPTDPGLGMEPDLEVINSCQRK